MVENRAGCQSLENWERWRELRRRASERLGTILDRPSADLLMNRDTAWHLRKREALFHRDWEKDLDDCKGTALGDIAARCLDGSLNKYNAKRREAEINIEEPPGHSADVKNLKIVGTGIRPQAKERSGVKVPEIVIDEEELDDVPDQYEPVVLRVGPVTLCESDTLPVTCRVEMAPVSQQLTQAREVLVANMGAKAISYSWRKGDKLETGLPLRHVLRQPPKFHFDKSSGILLPGQSFVHRFMFRSRTPGVFSEDWVLSTSPRLPKVIFQLVGVASRDTKTGGEERFREVEEYLEKCTKESRARDLAESLLLRVAPPDLQDYSGNFLEKEIFQEVNPILQYDMDCIRRAKELHALFSPNKWNYSMLDLCELLLSKTNNAPEEEKNAVMGNYCDLLGRLQKKPPVGDLTRQDWDRLMIDLCYIIFCSAVAQMEASMRRSTWQLPPPSQPPGPREEYCGEMFEAREAVPAESEPVCWTDVEEDRLAAQEEMEQSQELNGPETYTLEAGLRIDLEGSEGVPLPERRWFRRELDEQNLETANKFRKSKNKFGRQNSAVRRASMTGTGEQPSRILSRKRYKGQLPSPEEVRFHRAFQVLEWREILRRAVDNMVGVVEQFRIFKGPSDERYESKVINEDLYKAESLSEDD